MTSVGQRCRANGVYVRVVNVRRHVWQRKRWRPAGRPSFFTLAVRQRGQCGILIPSQRKQYQQRDANLAHCNFAVSARVNKEHSRLQVADLIKAQLNETPGDKCARLPSRLKSPCWSVQTDEQT